MQRAFWYHYLRDSNFCLKHLEIKLTDQYLLESFHHSNFYDLSLLYYFLYLLPLKLPWKQVLFRVGESERLLMPKRPMDSVGWNDWWILPFQRKKLTSLNRILQLLLYHIYISCKSWLLQISEYIKEPRKMGLIS